MRCSLGLGVNTMKSVAEKGIALKIGLGGLYAALNRAIALRRPSPGAIHHSDRGSQYCSDVYQARLGEFGFLVSMSGKGNCYDNAAVETFFKTIKSELIWRTVFMSRNQAEIAIAGYIDGFYNPVRRHSTLGFISPVKFETNALQPA
jgi:putative transposase